MKSKQRGFTAAELLSVGFFLLLLVGVIGWVMNIIDLAHMNFGHITGMLVLRAIGIFVAPLGSVLGFF